MRVRRERCRGRRPTRRFELGNGLRSADRVSERRRATRRGDYDIVHDLEKTLSLAAYTEVLLTGNDVGAHVTLDGVRQVVIEMTRSALRGERAR